MNITWLGWAGVEIEAEGERVVVDALQDAAAVWAPLGDRVAGMPLPAITAPTAGASLAGLVTHLHRDHADAAALSEALAPGAPVLEPEAGGGDAFENLSVGQAEHELGEAGFERCRLRAWESATVGPFTLTALPAVDGTGDPQVSWAIEAGGRRVLHLGDTMFHGAWWRIARRLGPFDAVLVPVNGAVLTFPHRQPASPLPAVMTPGQAAVAARILGAGVAIPIHDEGYELGGLFEPVSGAADRFLGAAAEQDVPARRLGLGEALDLAAVAAT